MSAPKYVRPFPQVSAEYEAALREHLQAAVMLYNAVTSLLAVPEVVSPRVAAILRPHVERFARGIGF